MTANELADYLDNNVEAMIMSEQQHIDKAATMLRQQQESIEGLNRDYDLLFAEHQLLLKKEWVSLTEDDDIDWEEGGTIRDLFKAIEAKLKEKNH